MHQLERRNGKFHFKNAYVSTCIHNMTCAVQFHFSCEFSPFDIVLPFHPDLDRRFGAQMKSTYANLLYIFSKNNNNVDLQSKEISFGVKGTSFPNAMPITSGKEQSHLSDFN